VWAQEKAIGANAAIPWWWRIENAPISYVFYLGKLFYPVDLTVFYPRLGLDLPVWKVLGASLAVAGVTAAVLVWRRKCPYLPVGWFWYLGMLLPVIGLVQFGIQAVADRFLYLPQIGLEVALVWGVADLSRSWSHARWACAVGSAAMLAVLAACAWHQTSFWHDSKTLLRHALACNDRNYGAQNNLGGALVADGRLDEAITHFQKALLVWPDYAEAHYNWGIALAAGGQLDDAIGHYREALRIQPDYAEAHNNLGNALAASRRAEEAVEHYQKALEIQPDFAAAERNLGSTLAAGGRLKEAATHFRKALEIQPDYAEAHNDLGNALAADGRLEEAMAHYRKAVELRPDYVEAMNNLAWLLAACPEAPLRNGAEAVVLARRAEQLTGGRQADVLDTLAAAYAATGRFQEAVATARKALELATEQNQRPLADALRIRIGCYQSGAPFFQTRRRPSGD
jgi:tetratricopeptide (TPR) repeat protein